MMSPQKDRDGTYVFARSMDTYPSEAAFGHAVYASFYESQKRRRANVSVIFFYGLVDPSFH